MMLALALAIGFVAGLRSLTAPAAVSWAACLTALDLHQTSLQWMGSRIAVAIFTILALLEYVADKLPRTPNRTRPGPLLSRMVLGGLSGAALTVAGHHSLASGAVLGGVGALIGAFAGYQARRRLVNSLKVKDLTVAIPEDLVAIVLAYLIISRP
jgi:uncharacterized membrane protein